MDRRAAGTADGSSGSSGGPSPVVAVLIPCHNEEATVAEVVRGFRQALPESIVFVYDNASTDATAARAIAAGAVTRFEGRLGKGNVVRRMFADIDADVYVLVDGDSTYDPAVAPLMVRRVQEEGVDMVVGARIVASDADAAYRPGHLLGNRLFTRLTRLLFGGDYTDVFSGYRAFSRRFVKSLPLFAKGFEVEAELTTHAMRVHAVCQEIPTRYDERPSGSESKLRTYKDGARILLYLAKLYEEIHPLRFFGAWAALFASAGLGLGIPVIGEFLRTGAVARFPTAFLALGLEIIAVLCLVSGVMLRGVGRARDEARRLAYLAVPAPGSGATEVTGLTGVPVRQRA